MVTHQRIKNVKITAPTLTQADLHESSHSILRSHAHRNGLVALHNGDSVLLVMGGTEDTLYMMHDILK